jgi:phosphoribosylformimino-5-aminoimidazole carboxamide ribotide isomerase
MHFLPVIDIRGGIVVRALAGRRNEYRPLVSRLTDSTDPLAVATAICDQYGWTEVYVADLDAIAACDSAASLAMVARFSAAGLRVWLDAGVRDAVDAELLATAGVDHVVVGLETVRGPAAWRDIVRRLGPERSVFSLDLRNGQPLTGSDEWGTADAFTIADQVVAHGGQQMIVLDLARVGSGGGTGTDVLCAELVRRYPGLKVYAGGGVRGPDDVRRLEAVGVSGVLLASVLHDGSAFVGR